MDLALHPRFAQNQILYFTYSKLGERCDTTALATARFHGATLTDVRDLFVADAWSTAGDFARQDAATASRVCRRNSRSRTFSARAIASSYAFTASRSRPSRRSRSARTA